MAGGKIVLMAKEAASANLNHDPRRWQARVTRYVVAVTTALVATLIRMWLDPILGNTAPFITLFPALAFAVWFGGKGPGLAAMVAGATAAAYFVFPPRYSFAISQTENQIALIIYCVVSAAIIFMVDSQRKALLQVAAQKELLRTTLVSIGDAVIVTDADARVTMMNPTAERLTGWRFNEARDKVLHEVFDIVNEETRREVESPVTRAIRAGAIVGLANHTTLIAKDKTEFRIDDSAAPIRDEQDKIVGVVMVFRDIGERRAAEERMHASERRYRRLFETAHDGILILDANTARVIDVNRFMLDLLRQPREFFVGKDLKELGLLLDEAKNAEALRQMLSEGAARFESVFQNGDGRRIFIEGVGNIYQEENQPVIQWNIRDVSERKRFADEREANLVNERLLRMEAETANRSKDMFLATLSHEMRTPLNAIVGWIRILRGEGCKEEDLQEGLSVIERNTTAQVQLIEDVLDVSRIISGKMRLEMRPCELSEVIREGVRTVEAAAEGREIKLGLDLDPSASRTTCDVTRMQQVVWNLVSNAVKFTPRGGTVTVSLARERSNLRIQVTDTGQGMSPDLVPYVFDRFRQADSSTRRKFGGLGLGLSIVKHIVEAHGGSVNAESMGEGKGSTFTVFLPIRAVRIEEDSGTPGTGEAASRDAEAITHSPLVRLDGVRVLVVDDEDDSRRLLVRVLQQAGAAVFPAASAREALDILSRLKPEVLISDLGMPEEDGFDLIRQVRGGGLHPRDLPAVALTAFASKDDQRAALMAGFQVHFSKPIDPYDLTTVVASLTGRTG